MVCPTLFQIKKNFFCKYADPFSWECRIGATWPPYAGRLGRPCFQNNLWTKRDWGFLLTLSCSSRQDVSKNVLIYLWRSSWKFDFSSRSVQGHVITRQLWSCCMSQEPSWRDKHNETVREAVSLFVLELLPILLHGLWWRHVIWPGDVITSVHNSWVQHNLGS